MRTSPERHHKQQFLLLASFQLLLTALSIDNGRAQGTAETAARPKMTAQEAQQKAREIIRNLPLHLAKEIPTNFPVPTYPSNVLKTNFSNSIKGAPTAAATILTKDSPETAFEWYRSFFSKNNWSLKTPTTKALSNYGQPGQFYFLTAEKDRNQLYVFCTPDPSNDGTLINISWALKISSP